MSSERKQLALGTLALAWLAVVVALYYVSHKPFTPALALSVARAMWQTVTCLALVSLGGGLGAWLYPAMPLRPAARLALQAGLGLGLLSLGVLLVGSLLGLSPLLAWGALLVGGALLRRPVLSWWREWGDLAILWLEGGRLGRLLAAGIGLLVLAAWFVAAAPPVKFDALVYHLALPELYAAAGRIVYTPEIMFWGMPQLGEMLFTWALLLAGRPAAVLLSWSVGGLAVIGLVGWASQHLGVRAGWVAAAVLLSGHTLAAELSWGYIDWFTALFGLGMLAALDAWRAARQAENGAAGEAGTSWLVLAGAFAGLALGSKYTAGVGLLGGLVVAAAWGGPARLASMARFGLSAAAVSLPWWLKNFFATGSPFYPFFFPAGSMDRVRLDLLQGNPAWGGWQDAVFLPLRATLIGSDGAQGYSASIGPLLLGLGLWAGLGWASRSPAARRAVSTAAVLALSGSIVWAAAGRLSGLLLQSRLYFVLFPALAFLAAAGFDGLSAIRLPGLRFGRLASALVLLVFGLTLHQVSASTLQHGAAQTVLGLQVESDYLASNLGWYSLAAQGVRDLAPGERAVMLWEPRSLYCAPACVPDEVLDRWQRETHHLRDAASILAAWREAGFTHLLLYQAGASFVRQDDPRYTAEQWQALEQLLRDLPLLEDFGGIYHLYGLAP